MNLELNFSFSFEDGVLLMRKGSRKLLIINGIGLINELGNEFFANNISIPISNLEKNFNKGIVDELIERKLIKIEYGNPILQYKLLKKKETRNYK